MNTINQSNKQHPHIADANEIWGISFFWTKNLKCDEQDIKMVTERVIYSDEQNKGKNKNKNECF